MTYQLARDPARASSRSTMRSTSARSNGFVMDATAPIDAAHSAASREAQKATSGALPSRARYWRLNSVPSISGMSLSTMIRSGRSRSAIASPSRPLRAPSASWPNPRSASRSSDRISISSSTTSTRPPDLTSGTARSGCSAPLARVSFGKRTMKVAPEPRPGVDDQASRAADLPGGRRLARERGDVGRGRAHGQCPRLQLRRIEELPDERRKAIGVPHDRLELFVYVRRGVALECTLRELRVTADARHRSSQLVSGDREELLAEARGLLGDRPEAVLGRSDLLFGALTVDDRGRESVGRDRRDGHECLQEQQ